MAGPVEKVPTSVFKTGMPRDCTPQIARADQDRGIAFVQTENIRQLISKRDHVVSVTLLAEPAEAVQILPDL